MLNYTEEKKKIAISRHLLLILIGGSFALGIFIGATLGVFTPFPAGKDKVGLERVEGTFKFIGVAQESKNTPEGKRSSKELKPFKYKVNALIESTLQKNEAAAVSVLFRDLRTGHRFGIGMADKFLVRNQWKLPIMIAYFKWAESNPLLLRKTLVYSGTTEHTDQAHLMPIKELDPGRSYTVNDLIYRMIAYDDSTAYALLYKNLPETRLGKIFKDLDVDYDPSKEEDSLSLNSFAAFYRVLFNASYLSEEMSEKALRYLSQSIFKDGMASGIPSNIDIASKHGERTVSAEGTQEGQKTYQLHEFGIIYYPNRPFLLGVMVRGNDLTKLAKVIRDITRLVYNEVDQQL